MDYYMDAWMYPTAEEIQKGLVPQVSVTIHGKKYGKEVEVKKQKKSSLPIEQRVCVKKIHKDENGNTIKKYYGHPEAVKEIQSNDKEKKEEAAFPSDYKDGSIINNASQEFNELTILVKELRKYDSRLADELIWYHSNMPQEFKTFRDECKEKLEQFKKADPLADVRFGNSPLSFDDVDEFIKKTEASLNDAKAKFNNGLKVEIDTIKKDAKDTNVLIRKLQALNNLPIFDNEEDYNRYLDWKLERESRLNLLQYNSKQNYLFWKQAMKSVAPEGIDYDEYFDKWWNKPQRKAQEVYSNPVKIAIRKSGERSDRLGRMVQPDYEQIKNTFNNILNAKFREFDKGLVPEDQTLNEFFNGSYGLGYLIHRSRVMECKRQINSAKRKYNPYEFQYNLANTYNTPYQSKIPYEQLTNSEAYNKKRKLFLDALFKNNRIGSITKCNH